MRPLYYPEPGIDHSLFNLNDIWLYVDLTCHKCEKHQGAPNYFENSSSCIRCGYHDERLSEILRKFTKIQSLANKVKPFINYNEFNIINIRTQITFSHLIAYADEYINKLEYLALSKL